MEKTVKTETKSAESSIKTSPAENSNNTKNLKIGMWRLLASRFLSRKLLMTIFSVILLYTFFWRSVNYLYSFTSYPEATQQILVNAYSNIQKDFMFGIVTVIGFYLGISGLIGWKNNSETILSHAVAFTQEKSDQNIKETTTENKNINYTEHVDESAKNKNLKEFQEE